MPDNLAPEPSKRTYNYGQWPRIKSLFNQALTLPPTGRQEWLAAACAGDVTLLEDVNRLLADHEVAPDYLEPPLAEPPSQTFETGVVLAERFRIERLIGTGGMGEVYEAEDILVNERLALKTLRPELASNVELIERFRRELKVSRQIAHPNVCRVSEFYQLGGKSGPLTVFFTMELLLGETLAHRIEKRGRLTSSQAMPIIRQIAAGLIAAHRLGIVHRDLKPSNIMLLKDELGRDRAIVMDFGLARSSQPESASDTRTGTVMGTPFYMAPEQFKGKSGDAACDLYAFGVTIFEMLTGQNHPLIGLRNLAPEVSTSWERAIHACFDSDAAKRPPSALALVEMLEKRAVWPRGRWLQWTLAGAVCVGLIGVSNLRRQPAAVLSPPQAVITRLTSEKGIATDPGVTPDGRLLVYASDRGKSGDLNIWLQDLQNRAAPPIRLTDDSGNEDEPAISPDGKLIAYRNGRDDTLYVKPVSGGGPYAIQKSGQSPEFSPDGRTLVYWTGVEGEHSEPDGKIWVASVPSVGDQSAGIRQLVADFADARYPVWSPDGRKVLFRGAKTARPSLDVDTDWWTVDASGSRPVSTGAVAILRASALSLQAAPARWDGAQVVFSASQRQSTNIWRISLPASQRQVQGVASRLTTSSDREIGPALFSGGLVYSTWRYNSHIWRLDLRSKALDQTTEGDLSETVPSVSSDGRLLAFVSFDQEHPSLVVRHLQAKDDDIQLLTADIDSAYLSSDGRDVAYSMHGTVFIRAVRASEPYILCRDCGKVVGRTPDGGVLVRVNPGTKGAGIDWLNRTTSHRTRLITDTEVEDARISATRQLLAYTTRSNGISSRIFLARMNPSGSRSVPITPPGTWSDNPEWSGDAIIYSSRRDGFECLYRQAIDPVALAPVGQAEALYHFHQASLSPDNVAQPSFRLSVAGDALFLSVGSVKGNLWMLQR